MVHWLGVVFQSRRQEWDQRVGQIQGTTAHDLDYTTKVLNFFPHEPRV